MTPSNFKTVGHFLMDSTYLLLSVMIAYFKKPPRYIVVSPVHPTVCHVLLSQTALTFDKPAN